MSDVEEDTRKQTNSKSLKLRRQSIEVDVTALVKAGKLKTKSVELTRLERHLADYDKELDNIEAKSQSAEEELQSYQNLQSNMDSYFANELTMDLANDDHRELTAFLKKHVCKLEKKNF